MAIAALRYGPERVVREAQWVTDKLMEADRR